MKNQRLIRALMVIVLAGVAAGSMAGETAPVTKGERKPIALGICTSIDNAGILKEAGFDYIELGLAGVAGLSDEAFADLVKKVDASPVKPEAMNGFMQKPLVVVGPGVDLQLVAEYLKKAFARADRLGTKILVYGSAGTRQIPEGFPRARAEEQMIAFLRLAADTARAWPGIMIVIEPLRPAESNFINTVNDGLAMAKRVDRSNVRVLADLYHMGAQGETMEAILEGGEEWIKHCHIARTEGRAFPAAGDSSMAYYETFFAALHRIGYKGRVSVEGGAKDFKTDARTAHACLRRLAGVE